MSYRKTRSYVSLGEVVERLAKSNFPGDRKDVDRKEALDDILAALRDGTLLALGISREETNEKGQNRPTCRIGNPEQITPKQWRAFQYRPDENALFYEVSNPIGHTYQATWIEAIGVQLAAVDKLWPA